MLMLKINKSFELGAGQIANDDNSVDGEQHVLDLLELSKLRDSKLEQDWEEYKELQRRRYKPEQYEDYSLNPKVNGLGELDASKILDRQMPWLPDDDQ